MQNSRQLILDQFSTSRVLEQYIEKIYIPIYQQKHLHKCQRELVGL